MITLRQAINQEELEKAFKIRKTVFVIEQGVSEEIEYDGNDNKAIHILAYEGEQPVGCARMLPMEHGVKIGRVAVLKPYRGKGIGQNMCDSLTYIAREMKIEYVYLHAQASAKSFYEKIGFTVAGDGFYEADILHYKMEKTL